MSLSPNGEPRFVYFARFGDKYLKIGSSWSPRDRNFRQSVCPPDLDPMLMGDIIGCVSEEKIREYQALKMFRRHLVDGCREWFHLSAGMLAEISQLPLAEVPPRKPRVASWQEKKALSDIYGWKYAQQIRCFARALIEADDAECQRQRDAGTYDPKAGARHRDVNRLAKRIMRTQA